jgi:hypothetical protein
LITDDKTKQPYYKKLSDWGLIPSHSYSILDLPKENLESDKLIRLKSPWGKSNMGSKYQWNISIK